MKASLHQTMTARRLTQIPGFSSSEPETATDTIAAPAEDGSGTARPTGGSDTDAQFITGSSDPVPSTGGPFIPGGVDGDGPTASIGADNLDDLMGQMVDANDVWDKADRRDRWCRNAGAQVRVSGHRVGNPVLLAKSGRVDVRRQKWRGGVRADRRFQSVRGIRSGSAGRCDARHGPMGRHGQCEVRTRGAR